MLDSLFERANQRREKLKEKIARAKHGRGKTDEVKGRKPEISEVYVQQVADSEPAEHVSKRRKISEAYKQAIEIEKESADEKETKKEAKIFAKKRALEAREKVSQKFGN